MNKIPVTGLISTVYPTDNYPVIDPLLGIDGLRCVNSLTEMYNIPLERRRGGMVVGVQNTSNNTTTYYKLKPGVTWSVGTLSLTDWDLFFTFGTGGGTALSVKYNISNETIIVPTNYEYLLYGDLTIGTGGNFQNYGKTVIMNGDIILTDNGTYSNYGQLQLVSLSLSSKYSASFSVSLGSSLTINHGLGNSDIVYTIRDGNNYIYPNVEIIDGNNILVTTTGTISSGRINIMA
jgi:hypothetical protein